MAASVEVDDEIVIKPMPDASFEEEYSEDEGFSGLDDTKEEKEEEGNVSKKEPKKEEEEVEEEEAA